MRAKSSAKALRRREEDDERALRLAKPLTNLTEEQLDGIRRRARATIEYEGHEVLKKPAGRVKARGRKLLAGEASGK